MKKRMLIVLCAAILLAAPISACTLKDAAEPLVTQLPRVDDTALPTATPSFAESILPKATAGAQVTQSASNETVLAIVRCDVAAQDSPDGVLVLWVDDVLWIDGDDEATLSDHGIPPDEVTNDYAIVNEQEKWLAYTATQSTLFRVQYDEDYAPNPHDVSLEEFHQYMLDTREYGILAEVTVSGTDDSTVVKVEEVYTP